ncbi:peptide/nickel transport system permease protein [Dietzia kunjamensis subsp. schimae]|uniref:Peptide/nickel transport system permease protein n=1 Tax=Dietzia kunjamensis subsp. schimae TaxID=498198 RepID=A0ABY1N2Y7_9ACTN|nr:ABC transporter permease [Dietzia kunjamensis]SMO81684.1 peptide/nickel transport system permease protein [Dietzia kunjamensis subsp. schimae]
MADNDPTRSTDASVGTATVASTATATIAAEVPARRKLRLPKLSAVGTLLALGWTALIVLGALIVDFLPLAEARDPQFALTTRSLLPPDLLTAHPLGTDRQGLDILGGLLYGARVSIVVGIGGVVIGALIGGALGLVAGYKGGWVDRLVSIISDVLLAFPSLILLIAIVTVLDPTLLNVTLALGIMVVPSYARLVRANAMSFAGREFVTAARSLGAGETRIMLREVAPNIVAPVLSYSFMLVAVLIVAEASLSYLGLSIPRPEPTWGNMISAGQSDFERYPGLVGIPAIVLFLTVLSFNQLGEAAGRKWSPGAAKI